MKINAINDKELKKFEIINPYLNKTSSLTSISKQHNLNLRTLQRWVAQYQIQGMQGLNRKKRVDAGRHRNISPQTQQAIEGLALKKQGMSMATVTKIINDYCSERKMPTIGYYNIRKIVQNIPKDMFTLARYGAKKYADQYEVVMRRKSKYANQIWQIDHSVLSIKVIDCDGQSQNPWLTIVIDDFSRA